MLCCLPSCGGSGVAEWMAGQIWEGVASAGATVGLQGHWAHLGQPGNMAGVSLGMPVLAIVLLPLESLLAHG